MGVASTDPSFHGACTRLLNRINAVADQSDHSRTMAYRDYARYRFLYHLSRELPGRVAVGGASALLLHTPPYRVTRDVDATTTESVQTFRNVVPSLGGTETDPMTFRIHKAQSLRAVDGMKLRVHALLGLKQLTAFDVDLKPAEVLPDHETVALPDHYAQLQNEQFTLAAETISRMTANKITALIQRTRMPDGSLVDSRRHHDLLDLAFISEYGRPNLRDVAYAVQMNGEAATDWDVPSRLVLDSPAWNETTWQKVRKVRQWDASRTMAVCFDKTSELVNPVLEHARSDEPIPDKQWEPTVRKWQPPMSEATRNALDFARQHTPSLRQSLGQQQHVATTHEEASARDDRSDNQRYL